MPSSPSRPSRSRRSSSAPRSPGSRATERPSSPSSRPSTATDPHGWPSLGASSARQTSTRTDHQEHTAMGKYGSAVAEVADAIVNSGFADEQAGDVNHGSAHYALVTMYPPDFGTDER